MLNNKDNSLWEILLDEYFFSKNLRPATEESYRKVVNGFRRFCRDITPEEVTHKDVLMWRRELLREKHRSAQTWNNKVAHMRALYNFWISREHITSGKNPFHNSNVQREIRRKKTLSQSQLTRIYLVMQQLDDGEEQALSNNALLPGWYWIIVLDTLRYTGMRLNQLLHVRLRDISLDDGMITLCREGSKTYREWNVPVVSHIRTGLARLLEEAKARGAGPSDPLFHYERIVSPEPETEIFGPPSLQPVRSFFRRLSRECGFAVSPHRFRHTLATILMNSPDRNLPLVKGLLGHRSVTTTMEYIDINMKMAAKTLEAELSLYTDESIKEQIAGR